MLAVRRGWTSISEQWVNQERIDELTRLAADGALPLRVDAYLALNYDREFFGDWYAEREPGPVDDRLRVQGLKIHLDDGLGRAINWEPADYGSLMIWMRLPQVSSNTAEVTPPISVGSWVNRTPLERSRSNSA